MTKNKTLLDRYTFADTERGRNLRFQTVQSLNSQGIECTTSEETLRGDGWECVLLLLTVTSKRPGEGQIAADMKQRSTKV